METFCSACQLSHIDRHGSAYIQPRVSRAYRCADFSIREGRAYQQLMYSHPYNSKSTTRVGTAVSASLHHITSPMFVVEIVRMCRRQVPRMGQYVQLRRRLDANCCRCRNPNAMHLIIPSSPVESRPIPCHSIPVQPKEIGEKKMPPQCTQSQSGVCVVCPHTPKKICESA
jgi:hypothetical protein